MITQMDRFKRLFGQDNAVRWEQVFSVELPRVLNYFRFHGVDDATAEDLTALTFEKAWRSRQSYSSGKSGVATWLYAIARHTMVDHFRTAHKDVSLEVLEEAAGGFVDASAEEMVQQNEVRERLRRMLARLPDRERDLIALKYGAEMTNRAIASQTGLSESNVGTIIHRVVRDLRRQMEEEK